MNLQKVHLNPSTRIIEFIGNLLMIRPIERKLLTKTVLSLLVCFCCFSWTLNRSFLSVNAATNVVSNSFSYGNYEMRYYTDSSDFIMDFNGTTFSGKAILEYDIYFDKYYSGTFKITNPSNTQSTNWTLYCENSVISNHSSSNSGSYTLAVSNVEFVKIIMACTVNINNLYPSLGSWDLTESSGDIQSTLNNIDMLIEDCLYTLNDILSLIGRPGDTPINQTLLTYLPYLSSLSNIDANLSNFMMQHNNLMSYLKYWDNYNTSGYTTHSYTYNNLNDYHIQLSNMNYDIARLMFEFNTKSLFDGNYAIFNLYFRLNSTFTLNDIKDMKVKIRDMTTNARDVKYFYLYDFSPFNQICVIALYIPLGNIFTYNNNVQIDLSNFVLRGVTNFEFAYLGCVDSLPDIETINTITNETVDNIDSITSDLNDQISESNSATSSTEALLNNFNQNLDLSDYNFNISSDDSVNYFKLKLTNIYDINEFKPFYLIPIILFVLGRILAG